MAETIETLGVILSLNDFKSFKVLEGFQLGQIHDFRDAGTVYWFCWIADFFCSKIKVNTLHYEISWE